MNKINELIVYHTNMIKSLKDSGKNDTTMRYHENQLNVLLRHHARNNNDIARKPENKKSVSSLLSWANRNLKIGDILKLSGDRSPDPVRILKVDNDFITVERVKINHTGVVQATYEGSYSMLLVRKIYNNNTNTWNSINNLI